LNNKQSLLNILCSAEIIQFVKCPELLQHGVFRPALTHTHLDIPDYIRKCLCQCWDEDPEVRPDIRLVRMHLKELQAGLYVPIKSEHKL